MSSNYLNRVTSLPEEFVWGAATAAYQVEGATKEGGKGQNMWDVFLEEQGTFSPNPASDFYHRYAEDLTLAQQHNINALRLSISWVRIFPDIDGEPNQEGVNFYHNLFDACLERGITPYISLHHFDSPQQMLVDGDWLNRNNINRFLRYAEFCFTEFSEIDNWFTINELISLASGQYLGGQFPPNHVFNVSEAIQAEHNMLLAHARAVLKFHELECTGRIGCIHALKPVYPITDTPENMQAAARYDAYNNRFLLDGTLLGEYTSETMELLNQVLEENEASLVIEPDDMTYIKAAAPLNGLFGMNYYRSEFIQEYDGESEDQFNSTGDKGTSAFKFKGVGEFVKKEGVPTTDWDWNIYPRGMYDMLIRIKNTYPNVPTIYITENGTALKDPKPVGDEIINDAPRIDYIDQHVEQLLLARDSGVNVQGYFVWSLQDQFSWANGYNKRYGLFYVDFETQKRSIKKSALWFKSLGKTISKYQE